MVDMSRHNSMVQSSRLVPGPNVCHLQLLYIIVMQAKGQVRRLRNKVSL